MVYENVQIALDRAMIVMLIHRMAMLRKQAHITLLQATETKFIQFNKFSFSVGI